MSQPTTTRTAPCTRYVFVRVAQTMVHDVERASGIVAGLASRDDLDMSQLTEKGKLMALRLSVDSIMEVCRGNYVLDHAVAFEKPILWFDDSQAAASTIEHAPGWQKASCINGDIWRIHKNNNVGVQPVFMMASATTIIAFLRQVVLSSSTHFLQSFGPPIGSLTIVDVLNNGNVFVHCVGNTVLNPDVCWWNNSA